MMRQKLETNGKLGAKAAAVTEFATEQAKVDAAIDNAVQQSRQKRAINEMSGLGWEGDLEAMRQARGFVG